MSAVKKTNLYVILLAWTIALIPLGWGLYNTIQKAMPLFTN